MNEVFKYRGRLARRAVGILADHGEGEGAGWRHRTCSSTCAAALPA